MFGDEHQFLLLERGAGLFSLFAGDHMLDSWLSFRGGDRPASVFDVYLLTRCSSGYAGGEHFSRSMTVLLFRLSALRSPPLIPDMEVFPGGPMRASGPDAFGNGCPLMPSRLTPIASGVRFLLLEVHALSTQIGC